MRPVLGQLRRIPGDWRPRPITIGTRVVRFYLGLLGLGFLGLGLLSPSAFAGRVQPLLLDLAEKGPTTSSMAGSGSSALSAPVLPDGRWRLLLWLKDGDSAPEVAASSRKLGFEVKSMHGREVEVIGSSKQIQKLADIPGVDYVARPLTPFLPVPPPTMGEEYGDSPASVVAGSGYDPGSHPGSDLGSDPGSHPGSDLGSDRRGGLVSTEALEEMRVPEFHALGFRGRHVRVGVVDVGFDGYLSRVGNELPNQVVARDFSGQGFNVGESHGTACAEVIADIAPECELYLAQIATTSDLRDALEWFQEEDVEVLSHSLAWFLGGGDGTGPVADLASSAAATGLQWVTSSGNFRRSYWQGNARDSNGDGWIETTTGSQTMVGISPTSGNGDLSLVLSWNRWPESSDVSFQIDIFDGAIRVATSETVFDNDYPFAFRQVDFEAARTLSDPSFRIRTVKGSLDGIRLRVFRLDGGTLQEDDRIEAGSLAVPADSPWTISVGAYGYRSTRLESFSSHGPTGSGLMKPEVIGADGVSTSLARYPRFVGTSAACPHVAGALALLLSASIEGATFELHWSRNDLRDLLEASALPFEDAKESEQGWGRVRMILDANPTETVDSPLFVARSGQGTLTFRFDPVSGGPWSPGSLESGSGGGGRNEATLGRAAPLDLFDAAGRWLQRLPASRVAEGYLEYDLSPADFVGAAGRYWAREPKSGAASSFYWRR